MLLHAMQKQLTPRKSAILRALVEEYIRTAEPVPSQALVEKYHLQMSPATVRIELKALEEDGYVFQRHASGGRIPTDLGYRYFVERLMPESALTLDEQRLIRHQFYQVQHQLDQWVRLTASIMSQALGGAAVVTVPRATEGRLKHFELLSLHDALALLVVVMRDGSVAQSRLFLSEAATQEEMSRLAAHLNRRLAGQSASDLRRLIEDSATDLPHDERAVTLAIQQHLSQFGDSFGPDDVYQEGLTRMLDQPEFTRMGDERERSDRIRKVIEALEQHRLLPAIAAQVQGEEGVHIVIGGETAREDLRDVSIVVARYGLPGQSGGLLGIVGPTRMQYSRAVAMVRYMADLMSDLLADAFGTPGEESSSEPEPESRKSEQ
jgi:heat-inducible transcriptional repressor